jgi:hypothetical protein
MQALTDSSLLDIWERGQGRGPVERALLLLAAALPALEDDVRTEISIGERDAAVLRLRHATFGSHLPGEMSCPACNGQLEFQLEAENLLSGLPARTEREFTSAGGLRFRLPNSRDLLTVAHCENAAEAARKLLQRCCLNPRTEEDWSPALLAEVEGLLTRFEDAADIELQFNCASCGHAWADHLDVCGYFWEELKQRAERLLDDVHRLARAYAWDEQRILALSDARRAAYLARCDA